MLGRLNPQFDIITHWGSLMPVESFGYIDSLNANNPVSTDGQAQGDDHLRGIKATLLATFPNIDAEVSATAAQLNALGEGTVGFADGGATTPSFSFISEITLGLYRVSAGLMKFVGGRLIGNGTVPVGSIHQFLAAPENLGTEWLELDGSTYLNTAFPRLATHLSQGGTSFILPNTTDTGRFLRSRKSGLTAGTTQANVIKSHSAPLSGTSADHFHPVAGACSTSLSINTGSIPNGGGGGGTVSDVLLANGSGAVIPVSGSVSFSVTSQPADRSLVLTGTAPYTGDTETRPEALAVIICIKT